jgi:hypothetical protein
MISARQLILGLFAVLALAACRQTETENLKQDRIFCQYEIEYEATPDQTIVRTYFKNSNANGSRLQLSDPSTVYFDADGLGFDDFCNCHQRVYSSRRDTGVFTWTDTDAQVYRNAANLTGLNIDFPTNFNQMSQNGDFVFAWQGAALAADETISLTLEATASNDKHTATTTTDNATTLRISSDILASLPVGEYRCTLTRSRQVDAEEKTAAGATVKVQYTAQIQNVILNQ